MGYNQNHAGIHLVPSEYKWRTDIIELHDKYGAMLVENKIKTDEINRGEIREKFLKDIQLNNVVIITKKRGEIKNCSCGGKLDYRENISINFESNGKKREIQMTGKQCVECRCKIVVEKELFKRFELKL